jgi:PAS domain-containing protein
LSETLTEGFPLSAAGDQPGCAVHPPTLSQCFGAIPDCALILRLASSPLALVAADSGNLPRSADIPYEVFTGPGLALDESIIAASEANLARMGLREIFGPDPDMCVKGIPLPRASSPWATLLVKASQERLAESVGEIQRRGSSPEFEACLASASHMAIRYEWEVLSQICQRPSPCVVTNSNEMIVASNNVLCDLLGRPPEEVVGAHLDDLMQFEHGAASDIPLTPECLEITTSILFRPLFLFFNSSISLLRFPTACGDRTLYVFHDLYSDRRAGNSNILLIQKMSTMALSGQIPQNIVRKLLNLTALTLGCDLVCVLRQKQNGEMIVTPYSNRRIDTLRVNVIQAAREPALEPFFTKGAPVFCDNVEESFSEGSFFKRISTVAKFALAPVGERLSSEYALLTTWSSPDSAVGPEAMPLLRITANLLGGLLNTIRLASENEQEKDNLRRYTRLTAGRETRMAALKRENAQLRDLVMKLSPGGKDQPE